MIICTSSRRRRSSLRAVSTFSRTLITSLDFVGHWIGLGNRAHVAHAAPEARCVGRSPLSRNSRPDAIFLHDPGDGGADDHLGRAIVERGLELGVQEITDAS